MRSKKVQCSFFDQKSELELLSFVADPCRRAPCLHGGLCTMIGPEEYMCDCAKTGYQGRNCGMSPHVQVPYGFCSVSIQTRLASMDNHAIIVVCAALTIAFVPIRLR